MELNKILFLGGNPDRLASVKIRCIEIARRLGCDYHLKAEYVDQIPDGYSAFVCVKPPLADSQLELLAKRGTIIWDVIDSLPPQDHVSVYITSNGFAKNMLKSYGRIEVIPHHHCNVDGVPNPPDLRLPAWIGNPCWRPKMEGFKYRRYFVRGLEPEDVARVHRKMGIGLNLRVPRSQYRLPRAMQSLLPPRFRTVRDINGISKNVYDLHIAINSGVKLINCIGFGIPSVSGDEPAYHEFGRKCTVFTDPKKCAKWVKTLQADDDLYNELRQQCLRRSANFHIDAIAEKYRALLRSI